MKYRIDPSGVFFLTSYFGTCQLSSSFDIYICHGPDKNPIINKLRMAVNKRVCQSTQCEQTQAYPLHQCVWVNSYQARRYKAGVQAFDQYSFVRFPGTSCGS